MNRTWTVALALAFALARPASCPQPAAAQELPDWSALVFVEPRILPDAEPCGILPAARASFSPAAFREGIEQFRVELRAATGYELPEVVVVPEGEFEYESGRYDGSYLAGFAARRRGSLLIFAEITLECERGQAEIEAVGYADVDSQNPLWPNPTGYFAFDEPTARELLVESFFRVANAFRPFTR